MLSSKLKAISENENYTKQQKGHITELLLNILKTKLNTVKSTDDKISQADILADVLERSINVDNIKNMINNYDFDNIKPN
ncbi:MAG: hypothetical protein Rsou_1337 [Candidatus Ruthia sp. Asou_11_S2]|nr:hypothetical protein [Candidatus Ruthia sp. Asou_11_S2]